MNVSLGASNYSTLFSSLSTKSNNVTSSISLTDYASIKNGSYGKAVKAYYAEAKSKASSTSTSDSTSTTTDTDTSSDEEEDVLTKLLSESKLSYTADGTYSSTLTGSLFNSEV